VITLTSVTAPPEIEAAAVVALLTTAPQRHVADLLEERGSALALFHEFKGGNPAQPELFNHEDVQELLNHAAADIARWESEGIRMVSVLDREYPENLRAVHDRPPLIFIAGTLEPRDTWSVAVIGSRRASRAGLGAAARIAEHLVDHGYTVVSGLAAGIDTAAHTAALAHDGRTVAVIGTGLRRCYPAANAALQDRIARTGAVVSRFWPDDGPTQASFRARNAVMSGLARATVIVEASMTSGARVQARLAIAHGRPVFLRESLLDQPWAREFALKAATHVFGSPGEITATLERLENGTLVA
jgi:DNA processing protein